MRDVPGTTDKMECDEDSEESNMMMFGEQPTKSDINALVGSSRCRLFLAY